MYIMDSIYGYIFLEQVVHARMILHGQLAESAHRTEVDRYSVPVYSSAAMTCSVLLHKLCMSKMDSIWLHFS
jgi:hypothetical protein